MIYDWTMRHDHHFRITGRGNRALTSRGHFVWAGPSVLPRRRALVGIGVPTLSAVIASAHSGLANSICRYCGLPRKVYLLENSPICASCARSAAIIYDDSEPGLFRVLVSHSGGLTQMISYEAGDLPVGLIGQIARLETVRLRHQLERIVAEVTAN